MKKIIPLTGFLKVQVLQIVLASIRFSCLYQHQFVFPSAMKEIISLSAFSKYLSLSLCLCQGTGSLASCF
jgi:hypothetical protein